MVKQLEYICKSPDELQSVASEILTANEGERIFALYGSMGAGKTTFIKSFCKVLGVNDPISSPTFSLVNEYQAVSGKSIYHFDFYRIETIEEALDIGVEDYFYSGSYCFIEWPEKIEDLLPADLVKISILEVAEGRRKITIE